MLTVERWWTRTDLPPWSVRADYELVEALGPTTRVALGRAIRDASGLLGPVLLALDEQLLVWIVLRAERADVAAAAACRIVETVHDSMGLRVLGARIAAEARALPTRRTGPPPPDWQP